VELYLLRHARAEKSSVLYPQDHVRPLTGQGIAQMERLASKLNDLTDGGFDWILTSPMRRARQTAEIVAAGCNHPEPPRLCEALSGTDISRLNSMIEEFRPKDKALLVGHSPTLDDLVAKLISVSFGTRISMSPGCLALVDIPNPNFPQGSLKYLIPAEIW
jgi:phosphohistidine phosphatase